ncbi:MAG TPA: hypothetical protein VFA24_00845 [Gaiellaceae bacterium]|nr:hypothetical protein [Gaiellaceae bacterium]
MGGNEGNARITAATAAVLLVLLAGEGATIPIVRQAMTWHVFLGLLLVPPVLVKLGSVAWRFMRYYRGHADYVAQGPPHPFLRFLVGPVVVVTTVVLFGTGILIAFEHPHSGLLIGLHKASFIIWFFAMSLHVLAHLQTVWRYAQRGVRIALPGRTLRQVLLLASLVAGVGFAVAALPQAHAWTHWAATHHHEDH